MLFIAQQDATIEKLEVAIGWDSGPREVLISLREYKSGLPGAIIKGQGYWVVAKAPAGTVAYWNLTILRLGLLLEARGYGDRYWDQKYMTPGAFRVLGKLH